MTESELLLLPGVPAWHVNPLAGHTVADGHPRLPDVSSVHHSLPGYAPTPLREAPSLASVVGLRRLWIKDESSRLGLPSFKVLGAAYALQRALSMRLGLTSDQWTGFDSWQRAAAAAHPLTLVTATDGNHGRAVAHLARLLGLDAHVLVPADMAETRVRAIRDEGARVDRVDGSYDDAIAMLGQFTGPRELVLSDTSWAGYETIPRWVIQGYATIFAETDRQLTAAGAAAPDLVIIQAGVGALASAAVHHWRRTPDTATRIITVEPCDAACVLAALASGEAKPVPAPHRSIMAGLNCGMVSSVALPSLVAGLAAAIAIDDLHATAAVRLMHQAGFATGETGAAGFAALLALRASDEETRTALHIDDIKDVLILCTEGVTDPQLTRRILAESR
jgi:diaminopropionate ammonia-lyase